MQTKVEVLTWQLASCHSPQSSIWSWILLPPHSLDPDTGGAPHYPANLLSHCVYFGLCASASVCGGGTPSE